jgi:hypothetical protein
MSDRSSPHPQGKIVSTVRECTLWDASNAGEQTLTLLALADQAAAQGNAKKALRLLEQFAGWDRSEIQQVLINHRNDFTAVGFTYHREPVPVGGQGRYDSVHKLLMTLWPEMHFRLLDPGWEVPDHLLEYLGLDLAEVHEGLQKEREKLRLLLQSPAPAPRRLTVDLARKTITLDGIAHDVDSAIALRWVKVLADHAGERISDPELESYDPELLNVRTHRVLKHIPEPVRALLDTNNKGSRLCL